MYYSPLPPSPSPPAPPATPTYYFYWRCYETDTKGRRAVLLYTYDTYMQEQLPSAKPGECMIEDDMLYCGHMCEPCDFEF